MTATSCNPIGVQIAQKAGLEIDFGKWLLASAVPSLVAIALLPLLVAWIFPPRVGKTPEAPAAARKELAGMGGMSRNEWITGGTFVLMVAGWVFGHRFHLNTTSVAFLGFGILLLAGVITLDDIAKQGETLTTFLWLAVLFAMSAQLNELGFMGYVGERLASSLGGLSWPTLYVTLIVLFVFIHYLFVSQTSQMLALFGVFLDVGPRGRVPLPLMTFGLLFANSYFSAITPQGGSQNIIFAASGYLTQRELYKLGLITTIALLAVYLLIGSPWVYLVTR
jgi:DASS family divalent anion:Na+ symporter